VTWVEKLRRVSALRLRRYARAVHLVFYTGNDPLNAYGLSTLWTLALFIGAGYGFCRFVADAFRITFRSVNRRSLSPGMSFPPVEEPAKGEQPPVGDPPTGPPHR
jgi:hypothetical protein